MNDKNLNGSSSMKGTRRNFLKKIGLSTLPMSIVSNLKADDQAGSLTSQSIIRVRQQFRGTGWKYYQVKTVAQSYPPREDDQPFQPGVYGGDSKVAWKATGVFRVEKVDKRWWFVDPDGHPFISAGMNSIDADRNREISASVEALGGRVKWLKSTVQQLRGAGFNTAGYWSKIQDNEERIPYVYYDFSDPGDPLVHSNRVYGLMECFAAGLSAKSGRGGFPAFHPHFPAFCAERCRRVAASKDDPWLMGYFMDNELWLPPLYSSLEISPNDPVCGACGEEARRWWKQRGGETDDKGTISEADDSAWMAHVYEWYLSTVTRAIREHDQQHLLMGSRLFSSERNSRETWAVAGRYVDVVAINPYGMTAVPAERLKEWSEWANDKPVLVGEFYVKGVEASVASSLGAGMTVATQAERGLYYQNFTLSLLESKVCVGWHWHQYADGLRVNTGIVDGKLNPYTTLLDKASEINIRSHDIVRQIDVAV